MSEKKIPENNETEKKVELLQTLDNVSEVEPNVRTPVIFGFAVLALFVGSFFIWSFATRLDSASIAMGKIVVDTNRRSIQHLEGGIVEKISVTEGSHVNAGDDLITLSQTQPNAVLGIVRAQSHALLAREARLKAERDDSKNISFPKELLDNKKDPEVEKILLGQENLFKSRKAAIVSTLDILGQRVHQLNDEIKSLESQVTSSGRQLKLIQEEIVAVSYLEKKKLIERPRLLALQRAEARLEGDRDKDRALISRAKQRIGETKIQMLNTKNQAQNEILRELRETQSELAGLIQRKKAAEDVMARTVIKAPISGTVVGLQVHTIGGVVSPRETLMQIVPKGDKLIVEAQVNPLDIDIVRAGLIAQVQLVAYKQRHQTKLEGKVTHVSADSFVDEKTGATYYSARVEIDPAQLSKNQKIKLYPGMPVQVMIVTEKRRPVDYFTTPIKDSFHRAFREQ